ncbi:MAG: choline/carnitine O-acyltransferase [Pseudonocardia sp.]|nr:choline/carnitine O-acyltransferase [Pseudonocardia sp.]
MTAAQDLSPRTFDNEDRLPRVPLPTLERSCARFLDWCAPLLSPADLAATRDAVTGFLAAGSPAHALHAELEAFDAGAHSWLDRFWPHRYLGRRDRIALNANFFFLFEDSGQGQVDRAAGLVAGAVAYKLMIDAEELPPVLQRGAPLSMEQNKYLFSATRIPGVEQDTARTPYTDEWPGPSQERHIVVAHRGRLVRLDVIGPQGHPHTVDELTGALRAIVEETPAAEPDTSVGHLTTKARAQWATSRAALLACDPANATSLDAVETALFCLVLDEAAPDGPLAAADQLLHGNSANRWFDKAVSLIVFANGAAGYNGEHCNLDGTTVISMIDAVLESPTDGADARPQGAPARAPLDFVLDDALRADVRAAGEDFAAYAAGTATTTVSVDFSAERAKRLRCSPDAFAQLAFQLAHHRAKGFVGATYESIATRGFRHGRTEAMRVVTPEIVAFTAAMADGGADDATRRAAFRAAAAAHVSRARDCQAGQAPEQHLWELQMILQRRGTDAPVPALYDSPGWRTMRDDFLSTSAVPSPHIRYWGFGSTSPTCIGVGYAMLPGRFDLYLSTPRTASGQMEVFAGELPGVVAELEDLLAADQEK